MTAVVVFAIVGATGCGGGTPTDAVAEVGGNVITRAMVDHWLHIAAVRDYQLRPLAPVPSGVVPDPPRFARCVTYLKTPAATSLAPKSARSVPLKKQCEQRYATLRDQVLGSLITCEWLLSEGRARGLVATGKAIRQFFEMSWKNTYKTRAEFEKSLANTGETVSDQLFRARVKVISAQIEKQYSANASAGLGQSNPALAKFIAHFPKKWAARTSCRKGYVVPNCKQYRGKLAPEAQLP